MLVQRPRAPSIGEGGSIPFMTMPGQRFPRAQSMLTSVLDFESNAHRPTEFLHIRRAARARAASPTP